MAGGIEGFCSFNVVMITLFLAFLDSFFGTHDVREVFDVAERGRDRRNEFLRRSRNDKGKTCESNEYDNRGRENGQKDEYDEAEVE